MCKGCGRKDGEGRVFLQIGHVTPLWDGGTDDPDNLQAVRPNCHDPKTRFENANRCYGNSDSESEPKCVFCDSDAKTSGWQTCSGFPVLRASVSLQIPRAWARGPGTSEALEGLDQEAFAQRLRAVA